MRKMWSVEEMRKLDEVYPTSSNLSLLELFPNRTMVSIHSKACKLGLIKISSSRWLTDEHLNLEPAVAGFLAGIIEGEGTINIYVAKREKITRPQIYITNTDMILLESIQAMIKGKGSIRIHNNSGIGFDGYNRKVCYRLHLTNMDDMRQFLEAIEPYLISKRYKALAVLKLLEDRATEPYFRERAPTETVVAS